MTTTVYDRLNRLVASDSRWSSDLEKNGLPGLVLYVDDTGFGKLSVRGNYVLCLAGDGKLIERWKQWWKAPTIAPEYPPVSEGNSIVVIYAIDVLNNKIEFCSKLSCVHLEPEQQEIQAVFSGSGEAYALMQWQQSKCAKTSVISAMDSDLCTGGKVRFVDFSSGQTDIEDTVNTIADVNNILMERGFIVNKQDPNKTAISIKETHLATIHGLVANGEVSLSAPIGNENVVWDANAHQRLSSFIFKVIAEEKKTVA